MAVNLWKRNSTYSIDVQYILIMRSKIRDVEATLIDQWHNDLIGHETLEWIDSRSVRTTIGQLRGALVTTPHGHGVHLNLPTCLWAARAVAHPGKYFWRCIQQQS